MYAILEHQLAGVIARAKASGLLYNDDVALLLDALRDTDDELGRVRQATVGRCANCAREGVVVYFDREALVCADYEACVAFCAGRDSATS